MTKAEKNKGSRPRIEIDMDQLTQMVRIQCTAQECASVLGVSEDTIDRRLKEKNEVGFAEFYKKHANEGKASLRRLQWKAAEAGSIPMLIWLGKQTLGQRDKHNYDGEVQIKGEVDNRTLALAVCALIRNAVENQAVEDSVSVPPMLEGIAQEVDYGAC